MTLEQIRAMSDDEISNQVMVELMVDRGTAPVKHYSRDLNAAMTLVPSIDLTVADVVGGRNFFICLAEVVCPKELDGGEPLKPSDMDDTAIIGVFGAWFFDCPNRARKICEAFLLWKGSAT